MMQYYNEDLLKNTKTNIMKKLLPIVFAASLFIACNNNGGIGMGGGWSKSDQNQFMQPCLQAGQTKEICSCVLEKLEKKYANLKEADAKGGAEAGRQLTMECMNGVMGNENDNNMGNNNGENYNNNNRRGGWTKQQRQQYIQGCATTAQQAQGISAQQANQYCDCMTRKVEEQYTFQQAAQLTAQDFQTQEWQNAAADCRGGY